MELKEYRLSRLKKLAADMGAEMIVATLPANINYLTGGYISVNQEVLTRSECAIAYLPGKDKYVYIVGYADLPTVFEFAGVDAEVYFNGGAFCFERGADQDPFVERIMNCQKLAYPTSADAWEAAIRNNLPANAAIAVDESRIFPSALAQIQSKLPDYRFLDGTALFMEARKIKHPDEVAGVERSARCAAESLMAALADFKPGMTEYEIGMSYNVELAKRGAKPYFCTVTSQKRAAFSDTTNDRVRPIVSGDMIRFDFGCILEGYCSDLGRFAVVGEPTDKMKNYYAALKAGVDAAAAAAKPGITAGELFDTAMKAVRENGIPHYRRHHTGHGIGLECYDEPTVASGNRTPILENMTFNLETPYYELGWGGMMIEDTFAMTSSGVRMLDHTTRDIIRL
ncbi:MAG: Xaa-Pro peptidase family protein [Clostridiales bacterium]|nr:Xaa-Pro peptidase family protein [Clostridiales bacterium]